MISRNQVPGWLRRALRVLDFLKSLGCHFSYEYRHSCSSCLLLGHVVVVVALAVVVVVAVAVEQPK